jgi:lipase chaperone LimK
MRRCFVAALALGAVLATALIATSLRAPSTPREASVAAHARSTPPAQAASGAIRTEARATVSVPAPSNVAMRASERLLARRARSSLRGADPDGAIALDASGRLRLDVELMRRFEHYLSLLGEFTLDELAQLLHHDVQREHGAAVATQVDAAFARYLGLRRALAEAELVDDAQARLAEVQALRRAWFGADADALFGASADYDRYTLARVALARDATLAPEARERALRQLEQERPAAERAARDQASAALLADEQSRQFDALGVDADARHAERSALWGDAAAQRLAVLDRQRSEWEQRLQAYSAERQRVMADARLDPAARAQVLAEWRRRRFNLNEQARVEALEAIGALPPRG